jgi:SAM-dependent methyltransferase
MAEYVYDQSFTEERERLAGIERLWDPGTRRVLAQLGLGPGWRCLEVGAGGGSTTAWLAEQVGESGSVLATDVYTKFIEALELPNVEAREHNVLEDELPEAEFDLATSRLVAEHLGPEVIRRMVPALKPGGVLLTEDYDWTAAGVHPSDERMERVMNGILGFMANAGFDPHFGRRLRAELDAAGLDDVDAEGRQRMLTGGTSEMDFFRLSLVSLREPLVETGALDEADVEAAFEAMEDPGRTWISPVMVAAWGRRA